MDRRHRQQLERSQPFEGREWPRTLRVLSNSDKHRTLTAVFVEFGGSLKFSAETVRPIPDQPELVEISIPGQSVTFRFWNGDPVVETLDELAREVAGSLFAFQGDFGESDALSMS